MGDIDTSQTIEIMPSPRKFRLMIVGSALVFCVFLSLAMRWWGSLSPEGLEYLETWAATIVLALVTLALIWGLATNIKKPFLVISPQGLSYSRPRTTQIPWDQVLSLGEWSFQGQDYITLKFDPAFEAQVLGAKTDSVMKAFGTRFGFSGLPLMTGGTEMDSETLTETVTAYWNAYGPESQSQKLNQDPQKAER